jgi:hypothetical protein
VAVAERVAAELVAAAIRSRRHRRQTPTPR